MAITIEQLDNEYVDQNISILVGKNFILKFTPQKSSLDSSESLQKLIKTPDLLSNDLNRKVRGLVGMSKQIIDLLSESIKTREFYSRLNNGNPETLTPDESESLIKYLSNQLKEKKDEIIKKGNAIGKLEKEIELYLAQDNNLYFCKSCNAYLGDSFESLPSSCLSCGNETDWSDAQNITNVRFIDSKILAYLDGLWFEDYIAKLLNKIDWKTWCHGSIMGSSGIDHQVDILAINSSDGRVIICECKTAKIEKKHAFDLSAQFYDIKSSYGFLFSLEAVSNVRLTQYMKGTAGLCLCDDLKANTDEQIMVKIKNFLKV